MVWLPDTTKVKLGKLRFQTPEVLFTPSLIDNPKYQVQQGIHERIYQSIIHCDQDIRTDLYKNIILAGGTTMFAEMQSRLKKEIIALAPSTMDVDP